ncbi:MAG: glycosyltransferase family 4 protein [Oscillatoriales cyanobacterium RM2_1_1]|nr:glycosyltransferase family 4 protein [Oscillatoriales cyanobacterium SM2_3_0]NJO45297.1 glycosyltransferase family 4 protein [Oscillatoriales cyanobacterium RM2_1_1]
MPKSSLELLFLSTPVGPLGSGLGGGVELTLLNWVQVLQARGHQITVVAPQGSVLTSGSVVEISGELQVPAQTQDRNTPITMPPAPVLGAMWDYGHQHQQHYDLILNFAYDWLPFYLTPFLTTPVAHFVSMGSLSVAMNEVIRRAAAQFPGSLGIYTRTQAETFGLSTDQLVCLGSGIDLSQYEFCPNPGSDLAWLGRIAPEKGLEDAVAAAQKTGIRLKIMGKIQDQAYWQQILQTYPQAPIEYLGFLSTSQMQANLGQCRALLMTPRWVEAFGNVAIEALACGVPVIAYSRGGPTEIIQPGKTGWLVEPDSVPGLIQGIATLDQLDRANCRQQAETEFSLEVWGDRVERWLLSRVNSPGQFSGLASPPQIHHKDILN